MMALFALVIAMFALAPIVEAAECGFERPSAHQTIEPDQDDGAAPEPTHNACSHGHCHHAGSLATLKSLAETPRLRDQAMLAPVMDDLRVSHAPDGLERPPRA
jgi:hypothetical protein